MEQARNAETLSRRAVLGSSVAAAVATTRGIASWAGPLSSAEAQSRLGSDDALKRLMDGNARYAGGKLSSLKEDLQLLKQRTAEKQEPFAAVL